MRDDRGEPLHGAVVAGFFRRICRSAPAEQGFSGLRWLLLLHGTHVMCMNACAAC